MKLWHMSAERGDRRKRRVLLRRRVFVMSAAFLALGITWVAIGFFNAPVSGAERNVSGGPDLVERSRVAGRIPMGPARLTDDLVPAVKAAPGRLITVALDPGPLIPWDDVADMRTTDADPGGKFKFDGRHGRVRVSDTEEDGYLVRGGVIKDGVVILRLRAAGNPSVDIGTIPGYDISEKYILKICLAASDDAEDSFCESSDTRKWPEVDRGKTDPCTGGFLSANAKRKCQEGSALFGFGGKEKEYRKWKEAIRGPPLRVEKTKKPPKARAPSINDNPDLKLTEGHAEGAAKVAEPTRRILRWLVWTVCGACIVGLWTLGAKLAIRHKRSEAGAHAGELGWVFVACIMAGSGLAVACVSLLIDPF